MKSESSWVRFIRLFFGDLIRLGEDESDET
jgi:hypothetical protein